MTYKYEDQRQHVFTEDGQIMFLKIRDTAKARLADSGAVTAWSLIRKVSGDSWKMLACVDRLVEIGELQEVSNPNSTAGQDRIFIPGHK